MSPAEFYTMSWVEFNQAIKAHQEIEEHRIRKEYEIARFEAILIINPTLDRKDKIKDSRDLIRFDWENPRTQSVEEQKTILMGLVAATKHAKPVKGTKTRK
jgi:hypothetical protein